MNSSDQIKLFLGIGYETQVLESCNWDEEQANDLVSLLSYEISRVMSGKKLLKDDAMEAIRSAMLETVEDSKVEILMSILDNAYENYEFLMQDGDLPES